MDPTSKRVGLTLQESLLRNSLRDDFPPIGALVHGCIIRRVDPALGLLVELPSSVPGRPSFGGYAHISNVSDEKIDKVEKAFKNGARVDARVIGYRPMDGLASMTLKKSALEQTLFNFQQLAPGHRLQGTISSIAENMALVQLAPGVKVMCPGSQLSDLGSKQAAKKMKVGDKVNVRVLEVDAAARQCSVTMRKTLVDSKLPVLAAWEDATPGLKTHGFIVGVKDFGVFVSFYGGMRGLAHVSELDLAEGQKPG